MSTWQNSFVLSISWLSVGPRHQSFCSCESSENSILITEAVIVPNACTDVRIDQVALSKRSIVWSLVHMAVQCVQRNGEAAVLPRRRAPGSLLGDLRNIYPPLLSETTRFEFRSNVDIQPPVLSLRCSIRYVFHCYKLKKIAKAQMNGACARILQSVQRKAASHPTDQSFLHPHHWQPVSIRIFYSYFHP